MINMGIIIENLINTLWIVDLLKKMCLFMDWLIYSVAGWFFNAFYDIAKMDITLDGSIPSIEVLINRIKLFVGIFALFILVKTLLNYLAEPEKAVDSSKKIVINIFVSIVLLVTSSTVFGILNDFQKSIIEFNTIPKILLGPSVETGFNENAGKTFMGNIFTLFFRCDMCGSPAEDAIDNVKKGEESILSLINYTNNSGVLYEYPVVSGIIGIVMIYYFVTFSLALGVRIFKLFFLQVMSPIPIIAYINPKSKEFCNKYIKIYLDTYIELFVRLFTIILAYNLGQLILESLNSTVSDDNSFLVKLLLIIAFFQLAKEFPKLVSQLFNINSSLGNLKGATGFLGGVLGTGLGLASGIATGRATNLKGTSLAAHIATSGYKGAIGGKKGLSTGGIIGGISGFTSEMYKTYGEGFARGDQIYTSGGYGNYLKGRMFEKTGYTSHISRQRERLSDEVTQASQYRDRINSYNSGLSNLGSSFYGLYEKRKKSLESQYINSKANVSNSEFKYNELKQKYNLAQSEYDNYIKSNPNIDFSVSAQMKRNLSDLKIQMDNAEKYYVGYKAEFEENEKQYNESFNDYFESILSKKSTDNDLTFEERQLLNQRDEIIKMVNDIEPNADLSSTNGYQALSKTLSDAKVDADEKMDVAEKNLNDFKDDENVRISQYKKPKNR